MQFNGRNFRDMLRNPLSPMSRSKLSTSQAKRLNIVRSITKIGLTRLFELNGTLDVQQIGFEAGIPNMNSRLLYNTLGRFLSSDSIFEAPRRPSPGLVSDEELEMCRL